MSSKTLKMLPLLPLLLLVTSACSKIEDGSIKPPLVYRVDIQQGNVVDQAMVNKLRVGMDKKQVRFIMGSPLLVDPFHKGRWDYLFTIQEGGDTRKKRHITLYFEEEKLAYISGDIKVTTVPTKVEETNTEKSIEVPDDVNNRTFIERWLRDEPELQPAASDDETEEPAAAEETRALAEEPAGTDETPPVTDEDDRYEDSEPQEEANPVAAESTAGVEEENSGFFSSLWDKLSGGDDGDEPPDAEVLDPDLENK